MNQVFIVAGEISGDLLAASLVRALRRLRPEVQIRGIGGDRMAAEGVALRRHVREMAVLGFSEVVRRLPFFRRVLRETIDDLLCDPPDVVVLVDYPGFNLRLARAIHGTGPRVVYYICPQVWAWHRSRIGQMARVIDRLMVIFPFETQAFQGTGLHVDFVGHPLVDVARDVQAAPAPVLPWPASLRVAILPGSRRQEIDRILPPLIDAATRLEELKPDVGFLIAAASPECAGRIQTILDRTHIKPARIRVVEGETRPLLAQAQAAWVCSGTATVEAALMNCPHVVVYRAAPLTYWAGRMVIRVPHLGMVNLIAGREICPERLQGAMTPDALCDAIMPLLDATPERTRTLDGLAEVRQRLGGGGAAERAAACLIEELDRRAVFSKPRGQSTN